MTAATFGRGAPAAKEPFTAGMLPLAQKEALCRDLLAEFGVTHIRARGDELIHGCLIDPTHTRQGSDPTASLNFDRLVYKCLGCQASGGLLWFIAVCRGDSSTKDARRWLAKKTGDGSPMELADLLAYFDALDTRSAKVPIPTYSRRILEPWALIHPYLTDPRSEGGRGIPEQNIIDMQVGYAEQYGVSKRPDGTWITSERITLPHFWKGNLVGWQSRRLADDGTSKYLSSPDFPKDQTIYNYQSGSKTTLVVESMLSVVSHLDVLPCAEATFGASITDTQMRLLTKHQNIVLWMDNDRAGWQAVEGYSRDKPGMGEILGRSCDVRVVESPYAADPDDLTTQDALDLVAQAVPYSIWQRPNELLCYACREVAHDGACGR